MGNGMLLQDSEQTSLNVNEERKVVSDDGTIFATFDRKFNSITIYQLNSDQVHSLPLKIKGFQDTEEDGRLLESEMKINTNPKNKHIIYGIKYYSNKAKILKVQTNNPLTKKNSQKIYERSSKVYNATIHPNQQSIILVEKEGLFILEEERLIQFDKTLNENSVIDQKLLAISENNRVVYYGFFLQSQEIQIKKIEEVEYLNQYNNAYEKVIQLDHPSSQYFRHFKNVQYDLFNQIIGIVIQAQPSQNSYKHLFINKQVQQLSIKLGQKELGGLKDFHFNLFSKKQKTMVVFKEEKNKVTVCQATYTLNNNSKTINLKPLSTCYNDIYGTSNDKFGQVIINEGIYYYTHNKIFHQTLQNGDMQNRQHSDKFYPNSDYYDPGLQQFSMNYPNHVINYDQFQFKVHRVSSALTPGSIAGIAIGGLFLVCVLGILCVTLCGTMQNKKKQKDARQKHERLKNYKSGSTQSRKSQIPESPRITSRQKLKEQVNPEGIMNECYICLQGNCNCSLQCGHAYHEKCIKKWFEKREQKCPKCQRKYKQLIMQPIQ